MIRLDGEGPLYRQLYRSLRTAIIQGELIPDEALPSTRELAKSLQISRNVVINSYEQLGAEGYIQTRSGSGSFVSHLHPLQKNSRKKKSSHLQVPFLSAAAMAAQKHWASYRPNIESTQQFEINFRYGDVEINHQLVQDFRKLAWRSRSFLQSTYRHPSGLPKLRKAITRYVQLHRGCHCDPARVIITNGSQQALDIIARLLINPGDEVLIEEPGYRGAAQAFKTAGASFIYAKVDQEGLNPATFPDNRDIRFVYTTASHQFPTGAILSLSRRIELLNWAENNNAYIIEDDYDSEFRYQGQPIESIQGLDRQDRTIHMGTFSKVLSPVLRLGYLILPDALVQPALALKWCTDRHTPVLTQAILADYLDSPLFSRHLKRMKKYYGIRRRILIAALNETFGDKIEIQGTNAGIHLLVWFKQIPHKDEEELIKLAADKGVGIYSVSGLYQSPPEFTGLLLGYSNISEQQIIDGIKIISECIES